MVKIKEKLETENITKPVKLLWRYFCDACTGRATYASEPYNFKSINCGNCGAVCSYKPENWIKITSKEELAKINQPIESEI